MIGGIISNIMIKCTFFGYSYKENEIQFLVSCQPLVMYLTHGLTHGTTANNPLSELTSFLPQYNIQAMLLNGSGGFLLESPEPRSATHECGVRGWGQKSASR